MRIILSLQDILRFSKLKNINELDEKLQDNAFRHDLAKKYAIIHKLHNGATLEFPANGYRNTNLLFWDAQNKEIVPPFYEMDDYGSVPPRFVVGDGYFEPHDWFDEVEHNTYIFPARPLINEMKAFAEENPEAKKMTVQINGNRHTVLYRPSQMKDNWDSCVLEVYAGKNEYILEVHPGEPAWRSTIID
jgi:hypothetical protein